MQGLIQRVQECNTGLEQLPSLTPFVVGGKHVGRIKPGWVVCLMGGGEGGYGGVDGAGPRLDAGARLGWGEVGECCSREGPQRPSPRQFRPTRTGCVASAWRGWGMAEGWAAGQTGLCTRRPG